MAVARGADAHAIRRGHRQRARAVVVAVIGGLTQRVGLAQHPAPSIKGLAAVVVQRIPHRDLAAIEVIDRRRGQATAIHLAGDTAEGVVVEAGGTVQAAHVLGAALQLAALAIGQALRDRIATGDGTSGAAALAVHVVRVAGQEAQGIRRAGQQATLVIGVGGLVVVGYREPGHLTFHRGVETSGQTARVAQRRQ